MENYEKDFLKRMREERTTYAEMIEFCADDIILNNYIVEELAKKDLYFETFCGSDRSFYNADGDEITEKEFEEQEDAGAYDQYDDIYQYYIISSSSAERLATYTNELVIYNDDLDLYLLCVKHFGTCWSGCRANWKDPEEVEG